MKSSNSQQQKKVLVAGTFELIHPGHIALIQEAAEMGDVIVVIARDSTVNRLRKRSVIISEAQRLEVIRNIKGVTDAVLGNEDTNPFLIIEQVNPDIILLGPNQDVDIAKLREWNRQHATNIVVTRMKSVYNHYPLCSTSAIVQRKIEINQK